MLETPRHRLELLYYSVDLRSSRPREWETSWQYIASKLWKAIDIS